MSTPPGLCSASKIVTSWPARRTSAATVRPAGPEPTIATFFPVDAAISGTSASPCAVSQSAAKRSSLPIWTALSTLLRLLPTTQAFWHCSSCGQTRPQTAGRMFVSLIVLTAPR